jgi:hypothetical protein
MPATTVILAPLSRCGHPVHAAAARAVIAAGEYAMPTADPASACFVGGSPWDARIILAFYRTPASRALLLMVLPAPDGTFPVVGEGEAKVARIATDDPCYAEYAVLLGSGALRVPVSLGML